MADNGHGYANELMKTRVQSVVTHGNGPEKWVSGGCLGDDEKRREKYMKRTTKCQGQGLDLPYALKFLTML